MTTPNALSNALDRQRIPKPININNLQTQFRPSPADSLRSLLVTMGPFDASTDAFRFQNSFLYNQSAIREIRQRYRVVFDIAVGWGVHHFRSALNLIRIPLPLVPAISLPNPIIDIVIGEVTLAIAGSALDEAISNALSDTYGFCGGMAFAGYDFYLQAWTVDERLGVNPPRDGKLYDYLFSRLLDSLDLNALSFLQSIIKLHIFPVVSQIATVALLTAAGSMAGIIGTAIAAFIGTKVDIFGLGGPDALLDDTKIEWKKIKEKLDQEAACPIGLIYGNSMNPIDQHQVLAIGYEDTGLTQRLIIWDNNDGSKSRTLTIDFSGEELNVSGAYSSDPIKGIFMEEYSPKKPPEVLRFSP